MNSSVSNVSRDRPLHEHCWHTIGVTGDRSCPELVTAIHCRNCSIYSQGGRELLDQPPPIGYQQEWTRLLAESPTTIPQSPEVSYRRNQEITALAPTLPKGGLISNISSTLGSLVPLDRPVSTSSQDTTPSLPGQKTLSLVIFRLEGEWLALKATLFKEVTEISGVHTLPHRSNEILLGLVSIRGEIHLCISLNHLLGLEISPEQFAKRSQSASPGESLGESTTLSPLVYQRLVVVTWEGSGWVFPVDEIYGVQRFPAQNLRSAPGVISKSANTYTQGVLDWQATHVNYLDEELLFSTLNRRVL